MGNRQMRHVCATASGVLLLGAMVATPAVAAVELGHEATLAEGGYADIRVTSGAELAREQLSVLVLEEGASLDAPAAGDVVHLDQRVADEDGAVSLRVALPSGELDGYWLAVNTTGGTERYVAPLDGEAEEPTEEPTNGPTDRPTDEPTDGPTEEPTDAPTDGPIDGTPGEGPTDGGAGDGSGDGGPGSGDGEGGAGSGDGDGGTGSGDGGADAGDGAAGSSDSGRGGSLSRTGAQVALAAGLALAAVAVGGGVLHLRRRAA